LLSHYSIACPRYLISYRQGAEGRGGDRLLGFLESGLTVALCSDGGYPGISDPGYRLIREAVGRGIECVVIPGASAVATALVVSGLPTSSYTFKGYPPRKPGALRRFFEEEQALAHTLVVFESPYRVGKTLEAAMEVMGDREAAVCIELTKRFERVERGFLGDLVERFRGKKVKGEVTMVIAGSNPKFTRNGEVEAESCCCPKVDGA